MTDKPNFKAGNRVRALRDDKYGGYKAGDEFDLWIYEWRLYFIDRDFDCRWLLLIDYREFELVEVAAAAVVGGDELATVARVLAVDEYEDRHGVDGRTQKIEGTDHFEAWFEQSLVSFERPARKILAALATRQPAQNCQLCGDTGKITDRVDGEITCPDCGFRGSPFSRHQPAPASEAVAWLYTSPEGEEVRVSLYRNNARFPYWTETPLGPIHPPAQSPDATPVDPSAGVEVTGADRDAAERFGTAWRMNPAGKFGLANVLARHRTTQTAELKAEVERLQAKLEVGEEFLNKCMSAWSCGEPSHRVTAMLDAADRFRAALGQPS